MANQTYQLVLTGISCGQFVQNVLHYRLDDDSYANRLLAAKGLVDGWLFQDYDDVWLSMLPEEYVFKSVKARRISNGGGPEYVDTSVDGNVGTLGSGASVSGSGPVLLWFTDGGPRHVGKTFLPGIGADLQNGGEILSSALASLKSAAGDFRVAFPASGGATPTCTMVIPRNNDPAVRSLIVDHSVSKDIGQQRRRQLPV